VSLKEKSLLIVEDDEGLRGQIKWAFCRDYNVYEAGDRAGALDIVRTSRPQVVLLDLGLPPAPAESSEGIAAVREILEADPLVRVVVVSGNADRKNIFRALELGAIDYFTKPADLDEVRATVKRAFYHYGLDRERSSLPEGPEEGLEELVGKSAPMQEVFTLIKKIAGVDVPVVILGESGTGKELASRAIHRLSPRKDGPFVAINCSAIPENLLEAELFGHEKGAFTGAVRKKIGRFELAQGGTILLDEIAELSATMQVKLLRFLQEHKIEPIGGRETISVDARVMAASNKNLGELVDRGMFREDLYFRLCVITLEMPPLRERNGDLELLALKFLKDYSKKFGRNIKGFGDSAISAMRNHPWPGNVRELENRVKRAVVLGRKGWITAEDLGFSVKAAEGAESHEGPAGLLEAKEGFEKGIIKDALLRNKGVVSRAARELGISRQHLSGLLLRYGIKKKKSPQ